MRSDCTTSQEGPTRVHSSVMTRAVFAFLLVASPAGAASVLRVPADYARITDALAAAAPNDTVRVAAGTYSPAGEVFPLLLGTYGVVLEGAGMGVSVLDADGDTSIVHCTAPKVRVTGFTITGGRAFRGGGVFVQSNDAQVDHNLVLGCAAVDRGAAIFASNGSLPWIHHNVVWESRDALPGSPGDPHGIQLTNANALVEYNTIGRGDSNGLIVEGTGEPTIQGNIFFENGSAVLNRGRGICALGGAGTVIRNNVFFGNHIAAILVRTISATQDLTAQQANDANPSDGVYGNLDADPLLDADYRLQWGSPAIDAGFPGSPPDLDGTRADAGAFAFDQRLVGVPVVVPAISLAASPNPSRAQVRLAWSQPRAAHVRLWIADARGRLVASLHDGPAGAGAHASSWSGSIPGVYFARLEIDGAATSRTVVVTR